MFSKKSIYLLFSLISVNQLFASKQKKHEENIQNNNNTITETIKKIVSQSDSTKCVLNRNAQIKDIMLKFFEKENTEDCLKNFTALASYFQELLCLAIIDKYEQLFLLNFNLFPDSLVSNQLNLKQLILITKLLLNPKEINNLLKSQDCLEIFDNLETQLKQNLQKLF